MTRQVPKAPNLKTLKFIKNGLAFKLILSKKKENEKTTATISVKNEMDLKNKVVFKLVFESRR